MQGRAALQSTTFFVLVAFLLAGCSSAGDDTEDGRPEPGDETEDLPDDATASGGLEENTTEEEEAPPEPIYLEGTFPDGSVSCTASGSAATHRGYRRPEVESPGLTSFMDAQEVPPEAWGRPFTINVTNGDSPVDGVGEEPMKVCIQWGAGAITATTSGTVPPQVEIVYVGADGTYGASYVIEIT